MTKIERPIPHAARRLLCAQVLGVYLAMSWAPAALAAPTTPPASLAQVPEFLQQQPDPNVFVTVDNSGSMNAEFLPDSPGFPIATRMFPTPLSSPFAASGNGSPITTGLSFQGFAHAIDVARSRSATQNLMYYNPRLRYRPWVGTDVNGSPFADANPNNALFNPYHPSRGGLNLVSGTINGGVSGTPVNSGEPAFTGSYTVPSVSGTPTFAVYYLFETANANCDGTAGDLDCYTRVEVVPSVATYTIATPNQRDEPGCTTTAGATVCSYAAEIQNFANWFQYYRSRTLLARGAMGHAMAALGGGFRVGLGLLNGSPQNTTYDVDGFISTTVRLGVRPFSGAHRTNFYGLLNNHDVNSSTPSDRALYQVGEYFAWTDGSGGPHPNGPWADNPRSGDGKFAACRQSYHVYSTDGYWNNSSRFGGIPSSVHNADNTTGPVICPPSGAPCYQYDPTKVSGSFSNALDNTNNRRYVGTEAQTLADIAMYFWYRDLQPGMPNIVAPSAANPAFWQNLSIMAVALALVGTKTGEGDAFLAKLDAGTDTWPTEIAANGIDPKAADDLWHAAINSRGRLLVANDPQELSARLAQALREIIERAASGTAATATTAFLEAGNGVFTAEFSQGTWTGNLYRREIDPATLQFKSFAGNPWQWRASDQLPAPNARRIFTLREDGSRVEFLPQSGSAGVSSSQMTELSSNPSATAVDVIDYLRGDRSKERSAIPPGNLRDRPRGANSNVLGSIINSAPLYVKDDDFALDLLPTGTPGRDTYQAFVRANAGVGGLPGRTPLIWVGSNGGMFHAFNADTGVEVFAYVPRSIIRNLPELTKPDYQHRYFVDGVPASGDAYIAPGGFGSPSWRTVVIGSLGAGGRSVFAIDATDPAALGAGSIIWDLDETSLSPGDYQYLGHVFGPAFTARAKNGKWVAVFGNGPESDRKRAALFVVDLETGAPIRIIDTGDGSNGNPNGLSTPAPVFDANQQLIAVYAGDLRGNLWKFDLSSTNEASWDVAFGGNPLFKARNLAGQRQPIFARPLLRRHPNGGTMVIFGTGKLFSPGDKDNQEVQTLYGVWDKPSAPPLDDNFRLGSEMVQQAIKQKDVFDPALAGDEPTNYRLTNFPVNYGAGKRGWYLDLGVQYGVAGTSVNTASATVVTPRERMVIPPIQLGINLLAQSFVPSTDPCSPGGDSFLYRLDPLTGSFFGERSFGDVDSGAIQVPGSFGLLPFYSRTASSAPPGSGGTQPPPPPSCPPGATCTCPPGFDYVFSTGIDGSISGRCVPRGGIGAMRTWRQIIQ